MAVTTYGPLTSPHLFDPARGSFDPVRREPPFGVHRPDKSRQDRMPVDQRPRSREWQRRLEALR